MISLGPWLAEYSRQIQPFLAHVATQFAYREDRAYNPIQQGTKDRCPSDVYLRYKPTLVPIGSYLKPAPCPDKGVGEHTLVAQISPGFHLDYSTSHREAEVPYVLVKEDDGTLSGVVTLNVAKGYVLGVPLEVMAIHIRKPIPYLFGWGRDKSMFYQF